MAYLEVTERQLGDAVVLVVSGQLIADQGTCPFCERIDRLLAAGFRTVLVDLSRITYIDSAGVGALVWKYRSVTGRGGAFRLLRPSRRVKTILAITRLDTVFEIFDSETAALGEGERAAVPLAGSRSRRGPPSAA
jgi:anti-sigma B factor antagonist